ncbi:MAG: efflux RND transporter permease subunit [Candidatus Tectimicrobiota bacterium]
MVNAIIKWFLTNTFLAVLMLVAVIAGGWYALTNTPVDAIPDIGEKQVIVFADWPGRSPQDVDDQVTYPLTTSLTGTPGVKAIRSMSGFGFAMVFVIFTDATEYYWARSRVLERMNVAQQRLPAGVTPVLGPDATALGQIYWYTLAGEGYDLAELRSIQDWYIRYQLNAVEGVSEVASIGGFVKQYQIDVHPDKMRAHSVTLAQIYEAVRKSNIDVGAKVLEKNGLEFFIRGLGFIKTVTDLEHIVVRETTGTPIYIKNVATVTLGPDFRRGALDRAGLEVVGGVVLMRYGENPLQVMEKLQEKIAQIEKGLPTKTLPDGRTSKVRIVPFYDRTSIVLETIDTLKEALTEEALVASLVILIFLLHLRSTLATVVTLPLSVALCFILMYICGVDSNIMSLAGLAIAIGDVADLGIIMTENIYRHIATGDGKKSHWQRVYEGASEVGGAIMTAVSNTLVSFLPVFFLEGQEGKLFRPLAFTKTFAIAASVVLAISIVPLMCYHLFRPIRLSRTTVWLAASLLGCAAAVATHSVVLWGYSSGNYAGWPTAFAVGVMVALAIVRMSRERFLPLEANLVSRGIMRVYSPTLLWVLNHKKTFMLLPGLLFMLGMSLWLGLGTVLAPLEYLVNRLAYEELPPEMRLTRGGPEGQTRRRPLVEFAALKWQTVQSPGAAPRLRLLWRPQAAQERDAEQAAGLQIVREGRILPGIGREFMPPLDEGSLLYMPSLLPQAALSEVLAVNSRQDLAIATVPEVASVVGKLGRVESALDPAPIGMMETIIVLKPTAEWREVPVHRWFAAWPAFLKAPLAAFWPETRKISKNEILTELQAKTAIPGVLPTFLQPIQTRLVMLQTGFRAMMGVKIYGANLRDIETIGVQMEQILKQVPGATDVVADRIVGKPYIEFEIDREKIARYGVNIRDVQDVIEIAIGGENVMESVEGRERYPIRIRYPRDWREDLDDLEKILVPSASGAQIPLVQLAHLRMVTGPQEIKGERGLLVGYVTMNTRDRDEVSVVEDAEAALQRAVQEGNIQLPPGYYWEWSGQFENQQRATRRMQILVPVCLFIMFVMLYLGFKRWWIAPIIYFGVLVSASGGFMMLAWWEVNLSVAVWVGFLVLFGVVDDAGVVMASFLEDTFEGVHFHTLTEIRAAVLEAALKRVRPALMTTGTTILGLIPIFLASGRGTDVMQPMAIPSVGGMTVQLITMLIVPCLFCAVEEWKWQRLWASPAVPRADKG